MILSKKADVSFDEYLKFPPEELVENEESTLPTPDTEDTLNETKLNETTPDKMEESVESEANLTAKSTEEAVETNKKQGKDGDAKPAVEKEQLSKEEKKLKNLGLSTLCQLMLQGRSLDKSEQCSVWTRRPLRK